MKSESVFNAKDIYFRYGPESGSDWILQGIDLELFVGEIVCIVGPSGCGKTTLLDLIAGLAVPDKGEIQFSKRWNNHNRIGYLFQFDALLPWRKVRGNLELGVEIAYEKGRIEESKLREYLKAFHLDVSVLNKYPAELSGGMRQRVAIIQSLLYEPDVLLLDEPFSSLDYYTKLELETEFWNLVKTQNKAAVFITHDIDEAIAMGDRVIVMGATPGRFIEEIVITDCAMLPPEEARAHPAFSGYFKCIWSTIGKQMAEIGQRKALCD